MIEVVTGFHPAGYEEYGHRMVRTFNQYWTNEFALVPYIEKNIQHPNQRYITDIPALTDFLKRHEFNRKIQGKEEVKGWKEKDRRAKYCYKFDAYKFARIPLIIEHAMKKSNCDHLIWLDGDTYSFNTITRKFITRLKPKDKHVAYLGRPGGHSECGFILFNIPQAQPLITEWANMYKHDKFLEYGEWHNSYLFDRIIETGIVASHNMTPNGSGHVWFQSEIGKKMDHIKGFARKRLGYSPERYGRREA